jgi:hypothetical protein
LVPPTGTPWRRHVASIPLFEWDLRAPALPHWQTNERDADFECQSHSERELGGSLGHLWGDSDRAMITPGGYFDTSRLGPFQTARDQVLRWVEFPKYRAESLTSARGGVCKLNRHFAALKRPDWSRPEDAHSERAESRFAGWRGTY